MTLATTKTVDLSISKILTLAFRTAALIGSFETPSDDQKGWGADLLEVIVNRLHTKGLFARVIEFVVIELEEDVFQYEMGDDVLDVVGPGMFISAEETDITRASGETPVTPMTRDEWQALATKNASSRPSRYYVHRDATPPVVYFWPVPSADQDGAHVRLQKHRLRATNIDTSKTPDFERYWQMYFVHQLAHDLSLGSAMPMERIAYLGVLANKYLEEASGYSKQRPPQRLIFSHPTRWSQR